MSESEDAPEVLVVPVASEVTENSEALLFSVPIEVILVEVEAEDMEEREESEVVLSLVADRESRFDDDLLFVLAWGGQSVRFRTRSMTAER